MSTNEQPWDDETREFRGPTLGARILSFETQAEDRTRTGKHAHRQHTAAAAPETAHDPRRKTAPTRRDGRPDA